MIALDTFAVICLLESVEGAGVAIEALVRGVGLRTAVSAIAITECLTQPIAKNDSRLRKTYESFFASTDVEVWNLTPEIATEAAVFRARFGLKTPDAIHLATAIATGAASFATADRHFQRCIGQVPIQIVIVSSGSNA